MSSIRAKVSESGRLSIPSEIRKAVGLDRGGDVVVSLEGAEIRIRTVDEVVQRAQQLSQKLLKGRRGASVDAFLARRKADAAHE